MHKFLIFIFLISFSFETISQENNSIYVDENGHEYLIHVVKKGETAFGIAKQYDLNLNRFFEINPQAADGLQLKQELKIPFKSKPNPTPTYDQVTINQDSTLTNKHVVKAGETYWSISSKYSVSIDELKKANQLTDQPLQIGQPLVIPTTSIDTTDSALPIVKNPINPLGGICDSIFIHRVKKKETLYSISNLYKVSINSIKELNNGLTQGLKKGADIRILIRKVDCDERINIEDSSSLDAVKLNFSSDSILQVALLLPFMLDENDTIQKNCPPLKKCSLHINSIQSVQFLNGVLLAIDSLKKTGIRIELNVFDTKNDTSSLKAIFTASKFLNANVVIGPIYMRNIKMVSDFCKANKIHVLCPVPIPNQALFNNKFITRFIPSKQTMMLELAKYNLSLDSSLNRVLIVNAKKKKDLSYAKAFKAYYNQNLINGIDSIRTLNLNSSSNLNYLKKLLKADEENILVVPSSDIGFVSNFMTKLSGLINTYEFRKYKITVYGMEQWREMQTIDEKYKNAFNLHIPLSGKINYSSIQTINFIEKYRSTFDFDPAKFSFIGFDIAFNSFKGMLLYNNDLNDYYLNSKAIDNGYYFKTNISPVDPNSGFENKGVHIYHYSNYQLIRLD